MNWPQAKRGYPGGTPYNSWIRTRLFCCQPPDGPGAFRKGAGAAIGGVQ